MAMDPVPWHVHVKEYYFDAWHGEHFKNLGGGTILNKNTVLTAAVTVGAVYGTDLFVASDDVMFQIQAPITVTH